MAGSAPQPPAAPPQPPQQPQPPPQPPMQPPGAPQYYPPAPPRAPAFQMKKGPETKWLVLILVGMFLVFIGAIWYAVVVNSYPSENASADEVKDWAESVRSANRTARIIVILGAFLLSLGGMFGSMDGAVSDNMRRTFLLISAMAMLIMVLTAIIGAGSFSFLPYE